MSLERDVAVPGFPARVHVVTPAIVERTVARRGMPRVLSADERATFDAFPIASRRRDWLAGRIAAKRAVRAASRARRGRVPEYSTIETWNEETGAPRFRVEADEQLGDLNLSISHCDDAAIASVADTEGEGTIGVDIEVTKPMSYALVRRVMGSDELARLDAGVSVAPPSPLALWTAKEAALKASNGAYDSLRDVALCWDVPDELSARVMTSSGHERRIIVRHRVVGPYTIAVALCR